MSILWLIIGIIIGLLVAWFYLGARYKKQSEEREAELLQGRRETEVALERERDGHNSTKQRIPELEAQHALAHKHATSLTGELKTSQEKLEQANAASDENRDMQERLRQRDRQIKRLETDLAECRTKAASATSAPAPQPAPQPAPGGSSASAPAFAAISPASSAQSGGTGDDLTKIKGIGQVLKGKLNALGITTFQQIAAFTEADIERVNGELDFPGRIEREGWIEQARDFSGQ